MIEPPEPEATASPFRGFLPFSEADSIYFFGREKERQVILANLLTRRLTVVYGPSGVGKSSLINAGVVAALRSSSSGQPAVGLERVSISPIAPLGSLAIGRMLLPLSSLFSIAGLAIP